MLFVQSALFPESVMKLKMLLFPIVYVSTIILNTDFVQFVTKHEDAKAENSLSSDNSKHACVVVHWTNKVKETYKKAGKRTNKHLLHFVFWQINLQNARKISQRSTIYLMY